MQLIAALILAASTSALAQASPRPEPVEAETKVTVTITRPAYIRNGEADEATRARAQVVHRGDRITYEFQ